MRKKSFALFVGLSLLFINRIASAQTTAGTDFWLGFVENNNVNTDSLWIYVSSDRNTTGTVSVPQVAFSQSFSVAANSFTTIYIPNNLGMNLGSEVIQNKGIHIISNDSILVTCFNRQQDNADASGIFTSNSLDTEYVIMSYSAIPAPISLDSRSEFLIVATDSNTIVQITVTDTTLGGVLMGASLNVNLQEGQTYQVQSLRDLTGTRITSNKPVAVFSGNTYTFVPINYNLMTFSGAADHLYEQMLPVNQ
ncbi:MAG: IgGFc-binding protein [Bacteroidia bacterium]